MTDDPEPPEYTTERIEPQGFDKTPPQTRRQRRWSWSWRRHASLYA